MLLQQFQEHLKNNFPQLSSANSKFLLAVSGGIDSVVLTDLFYKSGFDFIIAHCNFQLRGEESFRDELFMASLKENIIKEVLIKQFNTKHFAEENKISIQEAARKLRYDWFEELLTAYRQPITESLRISETIRQRSTVNCQRLLATAHNADDNIETMLMYLFRGTGIHGLTGIKAFDKERKIIRPLLFATRKQIEGYAEQNNLDWVEDSSNSTDKYTRNFFRHKIIPLAEEQFINARQNLLHNIERFKDVEVLYLQSLEAHKEKLLVFKGNEVHIPILKLQQTKPLDTIIWEIIKDYNFHAKQIDEIKKLFDADNSSYIQSSTHRIIKNRNHFIIAPIETREANLILIEQNDKEIKFQNGVLEFEMFPAHNAQLTTHSFIAQLDAKTNSISFTAAQMETRRLFLPAWYEQKEKAQPLFY